MVAANLIIVSYLFGSHRSEEARYLDLLYYNPKSIIIIFSPLKIVYSSSLLCDDRLHILFSI